MTSLTLTLAVKGTALLAAAALVALLLGRRASAATRHALWLSTLGALVALPAAVAIGSRVALPVLAVRAGSDPAAGSDPFVAGSDPASVAGSDPADAAPRDLSLARAAGRDLTPPRGLTPPARSGSDPAGAVWLLGVAVALFRLALGRRALATLRRRSELVTDPTWLRLLADESAASGASARLVRVVGLGGPVTWGVLDPVVALPPDADRWPVSRRRLVLRHELAHVARRDPLGQLVAGVACALYWFHPGVWLVARRLRADAERACDDRVLAAGSAPTEYAGELLALAREVRALGPAGRVAVALVRPSELERRLVALLDARRARGRAGRLGAAGGALGGAALVVALSGFRLVPRAPDVVVAAARATVSSPSPAAVVATAPATTPAAPPTAAPPTAAADVAQADSVVARSVSAAPGGTLRLDLPTGGAVEITGVDDPSVAMVAELGGRDWRRTRVTMERVGDDVVVRSAFAPGDGITSTSHRFRFNVPRRYDVRIESAGGALTLRDLLGTFTGGTGGGEIRITRVTGRATLTTGGGDVTVEDADLSGSVTTGAGEVAIVRNRGHLDAGPDGKADDHTVTTIASDDERPALRAGAGAAIVRRRAGGAIDVAEAPNGAILSTGGGAVTVGRARGVVTATTGGGDVTLGPVDGSAEAHTGAGDVSVTIAGDGAARHDVRVTTGNGAVDLYLPRDLSARLDIETAYTNNLGRRTRIVSDWDLAVVESDAWDGREGTPRRYVRGTATLGTGRGLVRVRAVNGDVRIHRR